MLNSKYKLVPVEPTETMALAAYQKEHCRDVYKAMLAAAPEAILPADATTAQTEALVAEMRAGLERLTRERDDAVKFGQDIAARFKRQVHEVGSAILARAEAAEAQLAALKKEEGR